MTKCFIKDAYNLKPEFSSSCSMQIYTAHLFWSEESEYQLTQW